MNPTLIRSTTTTTNVNSPSSYRNYFYEEKDQINDNDGNVLHTVFFFHLFASNLTNYKLFFDCPFTSPSVSAGISVALVFAAIGMMVWRHRSFALRREIPMSSRGSPFVQRKSWTITPNIENCVTHVACYDEKRLYRQAITWQSV